MIGHLCLKRHCLHGQINLWFWALLGRLSCVVVTIFVIQASCVLAGRKWERGKRSANLDLDQSGVFLVFIFIAPIGDITIILTSTDPSFCSFYQPINLIIQPYSTLLHYCLVVPESWWVADWLLTSSSSSSSIDPDPLKLVDWLWRKKCPFGDLRTKYEFKIT